MAEYWGVKVEDIFNTMKERFRPEGAKDVDAVFVHQSAGRDHNKTVGIDVVFLKQLRVRCARRKLCCIHTVAYVMYSRRWIA